MSDGLSTATDASVAPLTDPSTYQFDTPDSGSTPFQSVLDGAGAHDQPQVETAKSGTTEARDDRDHGGNVQLPPDQPPGGSGPTHSAFGTSLAWGGCVAGHTLLGTVKGAAMGAGTGAVIGAGYGAAGGAGLGTLFAPGPGTVGGAGVGAVGGAVAGGLTGLGDGAFLGSAAGFANGVASCGNTGDTTAQPRPADHIVQSQSDPGLTKPTGAIDGTPTGIRSSSSKDESSDSKAQVDSENQAADKTAAAGYPTVQNPTDGPNPPLTPERMIAEGLRATRKPDLLLSNRVFDTYTPQVDLQGSVRRGIAEKIDDGQTHRVVVDLRQTTQTEASVRAMLRAQPISGLKEVMVLTDQGLGQAFRP